MALPERHTPPLLPEPGVIAGNRPLSTPALRTDSSVCSVIRVVIGEESCVGRDSVKCNGCVSQAGGIAPVRTTHCRDLFSASMTSLLLIPECLPLIQNFGFLSISHPIFCT